MDAPIKSWFSGARGLGLVFAAALGIRLVFVAVAPARPLAGDELGYQAYASSLLDQGRFAAGGDRASRMPGYPAFLAGLESFLGSSPRNIWIAQALLGSFTCVLIALACAGLLEDPWPAAAGLAAAFSYDLIFPTATVASESLYNFVVAAAFAAILARSSAGRLRTAATGLFLLAAYLVRPEILPAALAALALMAALPGRRFSGKGAACAAAVFVIGAGAWCLRNGLILHRFLPTTSTSAFNLYAGLRLPLTPKGADWSSYFLPPSGVGELARDASYRGAFAGLLRSSSPAQILKAYAVDLFSQLYPFLPRYDWTYVVLVPFWLAGLWLSRKRLDLIPLACFVLFSIATYTVFGGPVSRYRCEYAPALVILAAVGAAWLWERFPRRAPRAAAAWLAANLLVLAGAGQARDLVLALKSRLF